MSQFVVDPNDFGESKAFTLIPDGQYEANVYEVKMKMSTTGNQMISWNFSIVEGPAKGRRVFANTSLVKKALWKLREVLEGLKYPIPEHKFAIDFDELVGRPCILEVTHEVGTDGKDRNVVSKVLPSAREAKAIIPVEPDTAKMPPTDDFPF